MVVSFFKSCFPIVEENLIIILHTGIFVDLAKLIDRYLCCPENLWIRKKNGK